MLKFPIMMNRLELSLKTTTVSSLHCRFSPPYLPFVSTPPYFLYSVLTLQFPPTPSTAECARVAFQMSDGIPHSVASTSDTSGRDGSKADGGAGGMYRLRQVHVAHGGRLRASWQAVLAASPLRRANQGAIGRGSKPSLHRRGGERRSPRGSGYSWAIVRTRGVGGGCGGEDNGVVNVGPDHPCNLSCRVLRQGTVPDHSTNPLDDGSDRRAGFGTEKEGDDNTTDKGGVRVSTTSAFSAAISPWRWQRFDVETTSWLPGDVLSLWIRLDDVRSCPPSSRVSAAANNTIWDEATTPGGGKERRDCPLVHRPQARAFQVGVVDDARSEEVARILPRYRRQPPVVTGDGARSDRSEEEGCSRAVVECFYAPAFSAVRPGPGAGVAAAVRLDFAASCPMNMAAAGGSWA